MGVENKQTRDSKKHKFGRVVNDEVNVTCSLFSVGGHGQVGVEGPDLWIE